MRCRCVMAVAVVLAGVSSSVHAAAGSLPYVKKDTAKATWEASMAAASSDPIQLGPWHYAGPFDNPKGRGAYSKAYPPESGVDLSAAYIGRGVDMVKWVKGVQFKDGGKQNSLALFGKNENFAVYLYRTIRSPRSQSVSVLLGHDDGCQAWLNGRRILDRRGAHFPNRHDDPFRLTLKAGLNHFLMKVCQGNGGTSFSFAVVVPAESRQYRAKLMQQIARDFPASEVRQVHIEDDWRRQYNELAEQIGRREHFRRLAGQIFRPDAGIAKTDRDGADVALRRTDAMIRDMVTLDQRIGLTMDPARMKHARKVLAAARVELDKLRAEAARVEVRAAGARRELYLETCRIRRKVALANPLLDFDRLLFVKRERNSNSEGTGHHMCDQFFGFNARNIPGGSLYVLENPFGDAPVLKNLLADATIRDGRLAGKKLDHGAFISPEVSYDGKTVLFAHSQANRKARRWSLERSYHIFAVNADGTDLRQITEGTWNDFDPAFMPEGRIVFISERRGGFGRCHGRPVPVYTLHTMKADGSDIVCISYHESNEWQPGINHDGMIVYTRWDYVDRHFNIAHHPWITTPDGRDARAIHGNFPPRGHWPCRPQMEMDIRAIPGSRKYVATAAAHHGQAYGSLVIFDADAFDDGGMGPIRRVTPDARFPESECSTTDQPYGTPWPLNEDYHLCVWDTASRNYGIYLVDSFGNRELIYRDPAISCLSPIPMKPRPVPPVIPTLAKLSLAVGKAAAAPAAKTGKPTAKAKRPAFYSIHDPDRGWSKPYTPVPGPDELGELVVVNVYDGKQPWPKGTKVKQLRIIEPLIKSTPSADGPRIGVGGQSSARAILGTVPVEADGSVRFLAPIHRPLLFQAIDQNGLAVQSMRSDTYVMRGTRLACRGCHAPTHQAPPSPSGILALKRPASRITPDVDGTNPFNYPRLVQPVLDRNCVPCHKKNVGKKAPDLTRGTPQDNAKRHGWYASYQSLAGRGFSYSNGGGPDGSITIPGRFGAYASSLYKRLVRGHHKVKLSPKDLHCLTLWLENNTAFYGDYWNTTAQARGEVVKPVVE